jgi:PAS domain S-box-containing protein
LSAADPTGTVDPFIIADAKGVVLELVDADQLLFAQAPATVEEAFTDAPEVMACLLAGRWGRIRATVRRPDGTPCPADVSLVPVAEGRVLLLVQVLRDDALLEETGRVLDVAFQTAPIGMAVYDTDGRFVRANDALCDMLGQQADALIGKRDMALTHPDDRERDRAAAWRVLNGEINAWQTEKRFLRPGGGVVWVIANLTFVRDQHGVPLAWLGQFTDITARKTQEGELQRLAESDPLTGLASRRKIMDHAQGLVDRAASGGTGVLIMVDLDQFKAVNDAEGHTTVATLLGAADAAMYADKQDRRRGDR